MSDVEDIAGTLGLGVMAVGLTALGAVGEGVKAVAGVAEGAVRAVGDTANTAVNNLTAPASSFNLEKQLQLPENRTTKYTGEVAADAIDAKTEIQVRGVMANDAEGHEQTLSVSLEGVNLLSSFEQTVKEDILFGLKRNVKKNATRRVAQFKVVDCDIMPAGRGKPDDPLGYGFAGTAMGARIAGVPGAVAGGVLGVVSSVFTGEEVWHLNLYTADGQVHRFKLSSKEDGDRFLKALDCTLEFA